MLRPKIMRMFLCDVLSTESEYATNLEVKGGWDVKGWGTNSEVLKLCGTAETHCMPFTTTTHVVYVYLTFRRRIFFLNFSTPCI